MVGSLRIPVGKRHVIARLVDLQGQGQRAVPQEPEPSRSHDGRLGDTRVEGRGRRLRCQAAHHQEEKRPSGRSFPNSVCRRSPRGAPFSGPGLFESVYKDVLAYELEKRGLHVVRQQPVRIVYDSLEFEEGFKADLMVEDKVIVELKAIEAVHPVHKKQLITYLRSPTNAWASSSIST